MFKFGKIPGSAQNALLERSAQKSLTSGLSLLYTLSRVPVSGGGAGLVTALRPGC